MTSYLHITHFSTLIHVQYTDFVQNQHQNCLVYIPIDLLLQLLRLHRKDRLIMRSKL